MIKVAGVIIRRGKAYLAVNAEIEGGPYVTVEPVFTADLTVDDLTAAFEEVIAAGHPRILPLTMEDWRLRKDPILAATGAKSWAKLAKDSAAYGVTWEQDRITLYLHTLDEQGRFASGPGRFQTFPKDTPLRTIAEAILADVKTQLGLDVSNTVRQ